ncbi:MAG: M23 family metallopeptidase [Prevotellaceae bacterium]|nr:M23 family metallopeptidase [Prevotellaceae bacterium]
MASKKKFFQRLRFKYRVSILNENTLEEAFHLRLSRLSVFLFTGTFALVSFLVLSLLIFFTPIKHFLPGFADSSIRTELITETMRVDSLTQTLALQQKQMKVIKDILAGNIVLDTVDTESLEVKNWENLSLGKSKDEQEFVDEFEQEEKYNLGSIALPKEEVVEVFVKPVKGVITQPFAPKMNQYGVELATSPNEAVLAALKGTVVLVDYSLKFGYVIGIQHDNGFFSVYKNNERVLKQVGQEVRVGEVIGIVGAAGKQTTDSYLHFELWQKGKPVNPADYIIF